MCKVAKWTASLGLGVLAVLSSVGYAFSLDETDKIVVTVYEHQIREYLQGAIADTESNFCLTMKGLEISERQEGRPLGAGASSDVIEALKRRGYDVYSSNDCAYRGFDVFPRFSSKPAVI